MRTAGCTRSELQYDKPKIYKNRFLASSLKLIATQTLCLLEVATRIDSEIWEEHIFVLLSKCCYIRIRVEGRV